MKQNLCKTLLAAALSLTVFLPVPVLASVQKGRRPYLTILHTNDMHARVMDGDDNGSSLGMAWIAGAIRAEG